MSSKTKNLSITKNTAIAKAVLGDLEGPVLSLTEHAAAPSTMPQSNLDRLLALEQEMSKAWATLERHGRLDLRSVEELMHVSFRVFIECLKVIVREKLYREEGYNSLEDYMEVRWARTRKWAYDQLCWLEAVEYLESKGVTNPLQNLSIDAAQVFRQWQYRPEVFYLTYMRVVQQGEEPTKDKLTQEAETQQEFLQEADRIPELTFDEYRSYQRLSGLSEGYNLDADSADTLVGRCRREKKRPSLQALTKVARGDALVTVVEQLEPLAAEVTAVKELKKRKAQLEAQKRDQSQKLLDEIRNLDDQIRQHEPAEENGEDEESDVAEEVGEQGEVREVTSPAQEDRPTDLTSDFGADPKAFLEDAVLRLELVAGEAEDFIGIKEEVLLILSRVTTAVETIKRVLTDEALEPEPVPNE